MRPSSSVCRCFRFMALFPGLNGFAVQAATYEQAADAVRQCGVAPEAVLWRTGEKGEIVFGRKAADASELSYEELSCFMDWATRNKVKIALIGLETGGS